MSTKTLVTGAGGFIGGHVTRMLVESGRSVRAMLRPGEDPFNLEGLDVERVFGDIRDRRAVAEALEGCDRIFHLAAIYALWLPNDAQMYDVNVRGTRIVCEEALRAGVERMVYTSSIAAVGVEPGEEPANEDTPFNQWGIANDYVLSKYMAEYEAREIIRQGLPAVIVNPALPFGWGDVGPTPTGGIVLALMQRKYPGWFEGGICAVDVEDVARGHLLAEEHGRIGERYILGNANLKNQEFIQIVSGICGVPAPERRLPVGVLAGMGKIMERLSDHVTRRPPLLTERGVRYAAQHLFYDHGKARAELGYDPGPIEHAIERSAQWFRERGLV